MQGKGVVGCNWGACRASIQPCHAFGSSGAPGWGQPVEVVLVVFGIVAIHRGGVKVNMVLGVELVVPILIKDGEGHLLTQAVEPDLAQIQAVHIHPAGCEICSGDPVDPCIRCKDFIGGILRGGAPGRCHWARGSCQKGSLHERGLHHILVVHPYPDAGVVHQFRCCRVEAQGIEKHLELFLVPETEGLTQLGHTA